jgi:hypothetical protein
MNYEKLIKEALAETVDATSWTSVDAYYKGFHVKKSWPVSMTPEDIKNYIDEMIEAGFKPSWNEETSEKNLDNDPKWVKESDGKHPCPMHGEEMSQAKSGKWYHKQGDQLCMGTGFFVPKS